MSCVHLHVRACSVITCVYWFSLYVQRGSCCVHIVKLVAGLRELMLELDSFGCIADTCYVGMC